MAQRRNERRRVVVTGMGALSPLGNSVLEFWEGLVAWNAAQVREIGGRRGPLTATLSFMLTDPLESPTLGEVMAGLGFKADTPYLYGAIYGLKCVPWEPPEVILIKGVDWRAAFSCSGAQYPVFVSAPGRPQVVITTVEAPALVVAYQTNTTAATEAVTVGRPAVEALSGLVASCLGGPFLADRLWEGPLQPDPAKPGVLKVLAARHVEEIVGVTKQRLEQGFEGMERLSLSAFPAQLSLSLRWVGRGSVDTNPVDAFLAYYLAILPIIRTWYAEHYSGDPPERTRFRSYIHDRMQMPQNKEDDLFNRFSDVHEARNKLLKSSNIHAVTDSVIGDIRLIAWSVARFEIEQLLKSA